MNEPITSKQRILAAIDHRTLDRTPITFDAEKEVFASLYEHLGLKTREELFDALNVDTWLLLPGNFIFADSEIDKAEKTSIWGYKTRVSHYSGGTYDETFFNPLAGKDEISDIDNHPWPEPSILTYDHYPAETAAHSNRGVIGVFTWGAYHIATFVRGVEDVMLDFAFREDYAEKMINKIASISLETLENMLTNYGEGIDIIYMADDYCSQLGPLFSPADFRRYVMPYLTKTVDLTHKHGKKFLLHVCGAVRPLLPMIIEAGVDMLEPIQTSAVGMEPAALKRDFGKDLCFYGGMDIQHILCKGTTQEVADEVKRLIDILGKDGGYIIGPSHTYIQPDTPIENILTMYKTAAEY
jgi:uroporphyrinogen decarboxylase